ncbi:MAG: 7-cyano-7-deazaguanine synthase QueC [Terriglobia bacterium]
MKGRDSLRAVVLFSGGLDSTTALAISQKDGFEAYALTFRYGQRHECELDAAERVARKMGVAAHRVLELDLPSPEASALTGRLPVPKGRSVEEMASAIPATYVPARNTIFLSFALAWAEALNAWDIFLGVNALDYSGYPDCRPEYLEAFRYLADRATRAGVEGQRFTIHAPLISMSKAEIIRTGVALGVDYSQTHSCYDPSPEGLACGECDACRLRRNGFAAAGVDDPTRYAARAIR